MRGCSVWVPSAAQIHARSEIHQNGPSTHLAHDIGGFDVAVNDARGVHGRQGAAEVDTDPRELAGIEHPITDEHLLEGLPVDVLGPDPGAGIVNLDAMNDQDIWVAYARQSARLVHRGGGCLGGGRNRLAGEFERDFPLQHRFESAEDLSKTSFADLLENLEGSPWKRHGCRRRLSGRITRSTGIATSFGVHRSP